jgi:hypothetical protein
LVIVYLVAHWSRSGRWHSTFVSGKYYLGLHGGNSVFENWAIRNFENHPLGFQQFFQISEAQTTTKSIKLKIGLEIKLRIQSKNMSDRCCHFIYFMSSYSCQYSTASKVIVPLAWSLKQASVHWISKQVKPRQTTELHNKQTTVRFSKTKTEVFHKNQTEI